MSTSLRMLLYSDGSPVGSQALNVGKRIAIAMASAVDIMIIGKTTRQERAAAEQAAAAAQRLQARGIPTEVHRRPGSLPGELLDQAEVTDYDLIVVGSRGRQGIKRLIAGSRARSVVRGTTASVLVVKGPPRESIDDILVGSAACPASEETIRFTARLARALNASVALLHVMSQVALEERAVAADLEAEADELMARGSREGVHLKQMLEMMHEEGVDATALVRHGLIVEEMVAEAKEGDFDMLVIGAHKAPGIEGLLSSDLSEEIMLSVKRPVLIVHPVGRK